MTSDNVITLARMVLQARPGRRLNAFKVAVDAAVAIFDEPVFEAIYHDHPWLAYALDHQRLVRMGRGTDRDSWPLADLIRNCAIGVLRETPPNDAELLVVELRVLRRLAADPWFRNHPRRSACLLRLGDAWQRAAIPGADRQASRAQEAYEEALLLAANPLIKARVANNLADLLHKRADFTNWKAAMIALSAAIAQADEALQWYDQSPADELGPGERILPQLVAVGACLAFAVGAARNKSAGAQDRLKEARDRLVMARNADDRSSPIVTACLWETSGDLGMIEAEFASHSNASDHFLTRASSDFRNSLRLLRDLHPPASARVALKFGALHAVLAGRPTIEASAKREALRIAAAALEYASGWLLDLGCPEQAAVAHHDLGIVRKQQGDPERAEIAHREAIRILANLTRPGTAGPAWVAWLSRLAEVVDHSLSALARSGLAEVTVVEMAASYGRDADDLAALRWRWPAGVNARDYERYLRREHQIRILDGMEVGAAGPLAEIPPRMYERYIGRASGPPSETRLSKVSISEARASEVRAHRRKVGARIAKSRRRFQAGADGRPWRATAGPPTVSELRDIAGRANAAVVSLHAVAEGVVGGAILPDGHFRATLLAGLTSGTLDRLILGPGGWMAAYDAFRKAHDARPRDEKHLEKTWEAWLSFHSRVDGILRELGQSLWLPLVKWLSEGTAGYPAAARGDGDERMPPRLILIPAGPVLDVLPLSALAYDDPHSSGPRVAADDYQIVHAPTFRLLKHCLDRRDGRGDAARRRWLSVTVEDPDLYWLNAVERHLERLQCLNCELAEDGSLEEVRRKLPRRDVCIINGHARFDAAAPLLSFFKLSDDYLRLMDVTRMDLTRVELLEHLGCEVVLGAWNNHASGMAGFAGSLMAAGVGSVIGSLWCREDSIVSVLLANRLHEELARQSGPLAPGQALWQAATWLRKRRLKELEAAAEAVTDLPNERKRAIEELHDTIRQDYGSIADAPEFPLSRARHWAGLIAYGAG
jgi:tetratricopeptide (TPR) repeat protein